MRSLFKRALIVAGLCLATALAASGAERAGESEVKQPTKVKKQRRRKQVNPALKNHPKYIRPTRKDDEEVKAKKAAAAIRESTFPDFHLGVTGVIVRLTGITRKANASVVNVLRIEPGSPADGKLQPGDVLLEINGVKLEGKPHLWFTLTPEVRHLLGTALTRAEASDGKLAFKIRRGGDEKIITVEIPVLGAYSKTWPLNCKKSDAVIASAAAATRKYLANADPDADPIIESRIAGLQSKFPQKLIGYSLAGLFLLSTEAEGDLEVVRKYLKSTTHKLPEQRPMHTWIYAYRGLLLAEYYLRTGEDFVLPELKAIALAAKTNQAAGGWGHNGNVGHGYVQGGLLNQIGTIVLIVVNLSRECGLDVDERTRARGVRLFTRFAGRGNCPYGDHRPYGGPASNGKNSSLACALSLLDAPHYRRAAQMLSRQEMMSYGSFDNGHTGGGFNVIWRPMGGVHVAKEHQGEYQRHMNELAWFYDLSRQRDGSFLMPADSTKSPRYATVDYSVGLALAYTAPRRTLRITGKKPGRHSRKAPPPPFEWGKPSDQAFYSLDYCKGGGDMGMTPSEMYHLISGGKRGLPVVITPKQARVMMRHWNPAVRLEAAVDLGSLGSDEAAKVIIEALQDADPRVRRAACEGISQYKTGLAGMVSAFAPEYVSKHFIPHISKILKNPDTGWWEMDGAMIALAFGLPSDVRAHMDILKSYKNHREWWLRQSSGYALRGLGGEIDGGSMLSIATSFRDEGHTLPRGTFARSINEYFPDAALSPEERQRVLKVLTERMLKATYADGYARHGSSPMGGPPFAALKNSKGAADWKAILPQLLKYLQKMRADGFMTRKYLLSITGATNHGLIHVGHILGAEGKALMKEIEAVYEMRAKFRETYQAGKYRVIWFDPGMALIRKSLDLWKSKYGEY